MSAISDIFATSRALLNDVGEAVFVNNVLLPFVKIANNELSDYLITNGIPVQKQIDVVIPVAANTKLLPLPDDIIVPVTLYEKESGSAPENYSKMVEKAWEPNVPQTQTLNNWVWRNQEIQLIGSTSPRDVRLDYIRLLADIADEASQVEVIGSDNFLAFRTAALAARHVGENSIKANELDLEAMRFRDKLLQIGVRKGQSIRGRRRPFRLPFMARYY